MRLIAHPVTALVVVVLLAAASPFGFASDKRYGFGLLGLAAIILVVAAIEWAHRSGWGATLANAVWQAISVFRRPGAAPAPAVSIGFMENGRAIAGQIDIDLQADAAINIQLHSPIPQIFLYFVMVNRSPLDLEFDRMMFTLSVNQPAIYGSILRRMPLPRSERREGIHYAGLLNAAQVQDIDKLSTPKGYLEVLRIDLTAYFQTPQGWIEVNRNLQRTRVPVA